jgi:WD40 repeat protein
VDPPQYIETLLEDNAFDRVFDLAFTNDSRVLFSGHGSGTVRGWTRVQGQWRPTQKLYWGLPDNLSFAIASLAVSPDDELVAIAGQFNRLTLWAWQGAGALPGIAYDVPYSYLSAASQDDDETTARETIPPVTSRNSYLTSVSFARQNRRLMATADSLGVITVWDLQKIRTCLPTAQLNPRGTRGEHGNELRILRPANCPPEAMILAQWPAGQQGSVIREIAFDKTGCYLASTGDDGRISVWPLTAAGTLPASPRQARIAIDQFPNQRLNSIDLHRTQNNVLLIAADTPGHRVQLYRQQVSDHGCQ